MKKWIRFTLFILSVTVLTACGKSMEKQIREQLDLGQKFLSEEDYEEAVVAFQKVIELDDKNVEGYLKLSEAYIGLGQPEEAGKTLETGYEKTQDPRLQEALEELTANLEAAEAGQEVAGAEEGQKETEGQEGSGVEETAPEMEIPRGAVTGEITVEAQVFFYDIDSSEDAFNSYIERLGFDASQLNDRDDARGENHASEYPIFEIRFQQPVEIEADGETVQVRYAEFWDEGDKVWKQLYDWDTETEGPLLEKTITVQGYLVKAWEADENALPDTEGLPYYYKGYDEEILEDTVFGSGEKFTHYHFLVFGPYAFYATGFVE